MKYFIVTVCIIFITLHTFFYKGNWKTNYATGGFILLEGCKTVTHQNHKPSLFGVLCWTFCWSSIEFIPEICPIIHCSYVPLMVVPDLICSIGYMGYTVANFCVWRYALGTWMVFEVYVTRTTHVIYWYTKWTFFNEGLQIIVQF